MTTAICTLALWAIVESVCQTYDLPADRSQQVEILERQLDDARRGKEAV